MEKPTAEGNHIFEREHYEEVVRKRVEEAIGNRHTRRK